jgi:hypothetical protein
MGKLSNDSFLNGKKCIRHCKQMAEKKGRDRKPKPDVVAAGGECATADTLPQCTDDFVWPVGMGPLVTGVTGSFTKDKTGCCNFVRYKLWPDSPDGWHRRLRLVDGPTNLLPNRQN